MSRIILGMNRVKDEIDTGKITFLVGVIGTIYRQSRVSGELPYGIWIPGVFMSRDRVPGTYHELAFGRLDNDDMRVMSKHDCKYEHQGKHDRSDEICDMKVLINDHDSPEGNNKE